MIFSDFSKIYSIIFIGYRRDGVRIKKYQKIWNEIIRTKEIYVIRIRLKCLVTKMSSNFDIRLFDIVDKTSVVLLRRSMKLSNVQYWIWFAQPIRNFERLNFIFMHPAAIFFSQRHLFPFVHSQLLNANSKNNNKTLFFSHFANRNEWIATIRMESKKTVTKAISKIEYWNRAKVVCFRLNILI